MSEMITLRFEDGVSAQVPAGTIVGSLPQAQSPDPDLPFLATQINNNVSSLSYPIPVNSEVRFLNMADSHGWRVYRRSLGFLLAKAVNDLFPEAELRLEHSMGPGLFCRLQRPAAEAVTEGELRRLEEHMHTLVARDLPIRRRKIAYHDAIAHFTASGQSDKLHLLSFRNPPHVVIYDCEIFSDLSHGPLVPRTGVLRRFTLVPLAPGFVLHLPERESPLELKPFEPVPQLFQIYQEHKEWGRILGVNTVGRLNVAITGGEFEQFVRTAEALHEKKLARIADLISTRIQAVRLILIAGPSSAGKTTFAKRLETHLRVNGLRPLTLSTDNYFVPPEQTPRDTDGQPDFEHLEAVDLALLNTHLAALAAGEPVRLPRFDFVSRSRAFADRTRVMDATEVLIVEGIHALNPRLTALLPRQAKFCIYVSALTQLNIDNNNRISTTDNRLMRRLVRDHRYRGHDALDTMRMWPRVRRGEKRWVFPHQQEADVAFNSALDYELAVLKPMVEPLLMHIKPTHPEYAEARRLSEFLLNFLPAGPTPVPHSSILREYIGGSAFHY